MNKIKLATVWLDGCSGCHMSFLDMDERLLELASQFDLVYSPLVDFKVFPESRGRGSGGRLSQQRRGHDKIHHIRKHTKTLLIALGDCAVTGNVPAMRNPFGRLPILERAYNENASAQRQTPSQICRRCSTRCAPCMSSSTSTFFCPGCPSAGRRIFSVLTDLLAGLIPNVASLTRFGA